MDWIDGDLSGSFDLENLDQPEPAAKQQQPVHVLQSGKVGAALVDSSIEIGPFALDLDIRLVHSPGTAGS